MTTTIRRQSKILPVELDALRVRRAGVRSARRGRTASYPSSMSKSSTTSSSTG